MDLIWFLTILFVLIQQGYASTYDHYYKSKLNKEQIQLEPKISTIPIYLCKYEIDRIIFRCVENSNIFIERVESSSIIEEISRDDCLTIHYNQTFQTPMGLVVGIGLNGPNTFRTIVAGILNLNQCQGDVYEEGLQKWSNVVVQKIYTLSTMEFTGLVAYSADIVSLNSTYYKYSDLQGKTINLYQSFWFPKEISSYESIMGKFWKIIDEIDKTIAPFDSLEMQLLLYYRLIKQLFQYVLYIGYSIAACAYLGRIGRILVSI